MMPGMAPSLTKDTKITRNLVPCKSLILAFLFRSLQLIMKKYLNGQKGIVKKFSRLEERTEKKESKLIQEFVACFFCRAVCSKHDLSEIAL